MGVIFVDINSSKNPLGIKVRLNKITQLNVFVSVPFSGRHFRFYGNIQWLLMKIKR